MALRARRWGLVSGLLLAAGSTALAACETETLPRKPASDAGACNDCGGADAAPAMNDAGQASMVMPLGGSASGGSGGLSAGNAGEANDPVVVAPPQLTLRGISVTQTLEIPLMQAGVRADTSARPVPLIAKKHALVRAFVDIVPEFSARPLVGVLDVQTDAVTRTLVSERTISQSSLQDDLATSFVFEIAADDLSPTSQYRVRVLEADTQSLARYPLTGFAALDAKLLPPFELVVVPFVTNGIAPQMGAAEIAACERRLQTLYPSPEAQVTVAEPVTLAYEVNGEGDGWDAALDEIYALRLAAQPGRRVFYYGIMAPSQSYPEYCAGSCILGLSTIADQFDADSRGSIGVGVFPDGSGSKDAWDTLAHELGHAMGREHAPCGIEDPKDIDPSWPKDDTHKNAYIGLYAYDFELGRLLKPKPAKDLMSYCSPVWISDYTYQGIFDRLDAIAQESGVQARAVVVPRAFRLARVRRDGQSLWLGERDRAKQGAASARQVSLVDAAGRAVANVTAQVVGLDHAAGGYVWLPSAELRASGARAVDLRPLGGALLAL